MQIPSHPASSPPATAPMPPQAAPPRRVESASRPAPHGLPPAHPSSSAHLLQSLSASLGMHPDQIMGRWEQVGSLAGVAGEAGVAREDLLSSVIDVVRQGSTRESLSAREQLRLTLMATDIIDGPVRRSVSYSV